MRNRKNNAFKRQVFISFLTLLLAVIFTGVFLTPFEQNTTSAQKLFDNVFPIDEVKTVISTETFQIDKDNWSGKLYVFVDAPTNFAAKKYTVDELYYNEVIGKNRYEGKQDGVLLIRENSGKGIITGDDLTIAINEFASKYGQPTQTTIREIGNQSASSLLSVKEDSGNIFLFGNSLKTVVIPPIGDCCSRVAYVSPSISAQADTIEVVGGFSIIGKALSKLWTDKCNTATDVYNVKCPPGFRCEETYSTYETVTCNVGSGTIAVEGGSFTYTNLVLTRTIGVTRGTCVPIVGPSPSPTVPPSPSPTVVPPSPTPISPVR